MRSLPRLRVAALGVLLLGCRPPAAPTPATTSTAQALPPSRHATGEIVDANVPLQQGGVLGLAELRGKHVVLEVVDGAHRDAAVEADYAALLAEAAGRVEIVMVSLDAEGWTGDVPPFVLGWDPQGALGARLHAASVPTVMLLDGQGRVVAQYAGARAPGHAALLETLRAALGTDPSRGGSAGSQ